MNEKKGQAAMEYLMTYGWALLAIAIVVAALFVITQTQTKVEQCSMTPGFICNEPLPQVVVNKTTNQNYINFKLYNRQAQAIEISNISCTTDGPSDAKMSDAKSVGVTVSPSGSYIISGLVCKSGSTPLTLSAGQGFQGHVIIWYNYANDLDKNLKKQAVASVSSTVLGG